MRGLARLLRRAHGRPDHVGHRPAEHLGVRFQPVLAAYTGDTLTGLTRVRNQAQDWNGGPEQIRIRVEAGVTYVSWRIGVPRGTGGGYPCTPGGCNHLFR